ncbi:MAG: YecA family protein [Rubrivivax sp.]|nr:YecA family protein [Rubrivivax sp.]MBK7262543.1 YecA family protein [Rubrivivax sp.]MBK8527602.1 YecA family protein [Rubrivivax sp.]
MNAAASPAQAPLSEDEIDALQQQLDAVPAPLEPLDVSALDGYLCGVLLQPTPVAASAWLPGVTDVDGRALPPGFDATRLQALVLRRHAEIERAIARRDWFDPWIFQLDDSASPSDSVLPWVAGFAAAQDRYPALMASVDPALVEPLALLYLHFDRDDLEDADALIEVIDTLEPPEDLAEAVQDLVRALMLIADVTRPRRDTAPLRRPAARRAPPGRGRRPR